MFGKMKKSLEIGLSLAKGQISAKNTLFAGIITIGMGYGFTLIPQTQNAATPEDYDTSALNERDNIQRESETLSFAGEAEAIVLEKPPVKVSSVSSTNSNNEEVASENLAPATTDNTDTSSTSVPASEPASTNNENSSSTNTSSQPAQAQNQTTNQVTNQSQSQTTNQAQNQTSSQSNANANSQSVGNSPSTPTNNSQTGQSSQTANSNNGEAARQAELAAQARAEEEAKQRVEEAARKAREEAERKAREEATRKSQEAERQEKEKQNKLSPNALYANGAKVGNHRGGQSWNYNGSTSNLSYTTSSGDKIDVGVGQPIMVTSDGIGLDGTNHSSLMNGRQGAVIVRSLGNGAFEILRLYAR